jgi:hypothetical protein
MSFVYSSTHCAAVLRLSFRLPLQIGAEFLYQCERTYRIDHVVDVDEASVSATFVVVVRSGAILTLHQPGISIQPPRRKSNQTSEEFGDPSLYTRQSSGLLQHAKDNRERKQVRAKHNVALETHRSIAALNAAHSSCVNASSCRNAHSAF